MNLMAINAAVGTAMAAWQLISLLIPLVKQLVQTAETMFPAGGQGATKLKWVQDEIQIVFSGLDDVALNFDKVWPKLQDLITLYVSIANKAGWTNEAVATTANVAVVGSNIAVVKE